MLRSLPRYVADSAAQEQAGSNADGAVVRVVEERTELPG